MPTNLRTVDPTLGKALRAAAFTICVAGAGLGLMAQQTTTPDFQAALKTPANPFDISSSSSSSVSPDATDAVATERFTLSDDGMQPPPRRRYGRPRYTDGSHNPDGSNKYTFEAGGGLTLPTGGTKSALTTSFSFQGGVGRNFNKNLGVLAQFDWDNFGVQTAVLNNLLNVYNGLGAKDQTGAPLSQLIGSSHIWSLTLNPIYNFAGGERLGAYVIGGAGFYHRTATFSIPSVGTYCDPYYGCYPYQANAPIDSYTSNAFGVNGGVGVTYKFSHFASARFFAEARYVYTANSRRPYYDGATGTALSPTYFNVFPQNSMPATYIPIKFGIRF